MCPGFVFFSAWWDEFCVRTAEHVLTVRTTLFITCGARERDLHAIFGSASLDHRAIVQPPADRDHARRGRRPLSLHSLLCCWNMASFQQIPVDEEQGSSLLMASTGGTPVSHDCSFCISVRTN